MPRLGAIAALGACLVCVGVAVAARYPIRAMSHYHPPGADYSFVCGKVKGTPDKRAVGTIAGPYVVGKTTKRFTFPSSGKYTLSWAIKSPGRYRLTLRKRSGDLIDRDSYVVPSPPPGGEREGPFRCPANHREGWVG
jgi:hypothetical protein